MFNACSSLRSSSQSYSLTLSTISSLQSHAGEQSTETINVAKAMPENVHIRLHPSNSLVFIIEGSFDCIRVSENDLLNSAILQRFAEYFHLNAKELAVINISKPFIDQTDHRVKLAISSAHPQPTGALSPHASLRSITLAFNFTSKLAKENTNNKKPKTKQPKPKSTASRKDQPALSPFAPRLLLPFEHLLDDVINRFFAYGLVRRYPLIFGPWAQQLTQEESPVFPILASSLLSIIRLSPNEAFQREANELLEAAKLSHISSLHTSLSSLSEYISAGSASTNSVNNSKLEDEMVVDTVDWPTKPEDLTDEDAICLSMERLYVKGVRRPIFKGSKKFKRGNKLSDDEDVVGISDKSSAKLLPPSHHEQQDEIIRTASLGVLADSTNKTSDELWMDWVMNRDPADINASTNDHANAEDSLVACGLKDHHIQYDLDTAQFFESLDDDDNTELFDIDAATDVDMDSSFFEEQTSDLDIFEGSSSAEEGLGLEAEYSLKNNPGNFMSSPTSSFYPPPDVSFCALMDVEGEHDFTEMKEGEEFLFDTDSQDVQNDRGTDTFLTICSNWNSDLRQKEGQEEDVLEFGEL